MALAVHPKTVRRSSSPSRSRDPARHPTLSLERILNSELLISFRTYISTLFYQLGPLTSETGCGAISTTWHVNFFFL